MSRIGKMPIALPKSVEVSISGDNMLTVKGPKGELTQKVNPAIKMNVEDGHLYFTRPDDTREMKAQHGLYRALAHNMVVGCSEGFTTKQEVIGVGWKVAAQGQVLEMDLGYSHKIFIEFPEQIHVEAVTEKGKNPIITMMCCDKELLGMAAAKIRSLRKPEPYKGKGIRFVGEEVRKKAGKAAAK